MPTFLKVVIILIAIPAIVFASMFVYYFIIALKEGDVNSDISVATTTENEISQKNESSTEVAQQESGNKPVSKTKEIQSAVNKTAPPIEGDAKTKSSIALAYYPEATEEEKADIKKALNDAEVLLKTGEKVDILKVLSAGQATKEEMDEAISEMTQEDFEFIKGTLLPNIEGQLSFLQSPDDFSVRIISRDDSEVRVAYVLKENDKNSSFFQSQTFLELDGTLKVLLGN